MPPPRLILDCLDKIKNGQCLGVLIIPSWKGATYWPMVKELLNSGRLSEICELPKDCIEPGRGNNGIFNIKLNFNMVAFCLKNNLEE